MLGTTDHNPFLRAAEELALRRGILDICGSECDVVVHSCATRSPRDHETPGREYVRAQTAADAEDGI